MKKRNRVLFLLLLVVCGATGVFAQSESDFAVSTTNGAVTIVRYMGSGGNVVIPATIGGLPIVRIGVFAFYVRKDITSISIPASVTRIMMGAFYGCTGLTSVNIPAGVTSIDGNVFSGCTGLTSISVDPRNTAYTVRNGVLFNKTGGELIAYPAGLKERQYAIPTGVTSIGYGAFSGCSGLTSISIPVGVTDIGGDAFSGCTGLTSVSIPTNVTSIGWKTFQGCTGLTSVSIPTNVTSIGWKTFQGCTGLTSIRIGANVKLDGGFENNFSGYYDTNGKKAGLYTFHNGAWSYEAQ